MKQFALGDPEKQLVSKEYLTDLLNASQTPQLHKLLFLKFFNHLAMHYKLEVIRQDEGKEWKASKEISCISASCLYMAKEKAFPIFDFHIIVYEFPLFSKNIFDFLPPSCLHLSLLNFSIWFIHSCVATAHSLKKETC